jgi:hypothetical protein
MNKEMQDVYLQGVEKGEDNDAIDNWQLLIVFRCRLAFFLQLQILGPPVRFNHLFLLICLFHWKPS